MNLAKTSTPGDGKNQRFFHPIFVTMFAKLAVHTLFGFLLGLIGTALPLVSALDGLFQLLIGIFMIVNGLMAFDIHPFFSIFSFKSPLFIQRMILKKSKEDENIGKYIYLGALSIFVQNGLTQALFAFAFISHSPVVGALMGFVYIFMTSPILFMLLHSIGKLGSLYEKYYMQIIAIVILILGVFVINSGLKSAGLPVGVTYFL